MSALAKTLKSWRQGSKELTSPPFPDTKSYRACKQLLTRAWIKANCDDSQKIIHIPINTSEEPGKSNYEKLAKLKIISYE